MAERSDFRKILLESGSLTEPEAELLLTLADQARISNSRLAAEASMAPSTTLSRVNGMLKSGIISGFHTRVDRRALGLHLQAQVSIYLRDQSPGAIELAVAEIMKLPRVIALMKVTGAYHLVAEVSARDAEDLQDEVLTPISSIPSVERTDTALILRELRRASILGEFFPA